MSVARPVRLADDGQAAGAEVEGEIRGLVRREVASYRRQPEPNGETMANEAHSLVQRMWVTSVHEIDNLIGELQRLREFLDTESQRIQRDIAEYVQLADAAVKSSKLIAENMTTRKAHP